MSKTMRLMDGTDVDSASEAWRAECEARHALRLPSIGQRRDYLARVEAKRGAEARAALEALAMRIWRAEQPSG